jgi:hypothetical protein
MSDLTDKLRYVNKEKIDEITQISISDYNILKELIEISLQDEEYISQHAALIILSIAKIEPSILFEFKDLIIGAIPTLTNNSKLGNFIEILEHTDFDCSKLYDFCFDLIENSDKPGFVKIYGIKMLGNAAKKDEVLKQRLIEFIENTHEKLKSRYLIKETLIILKTLK